MSDSDDAASLEKLNQAISCLEEQIETARKIKCPAQTTLINKAQLIKKYTLQLEKLMASFYSISETNKKKRGF